MKAFFAAAIVAGAAVSAHAAVSWTELPLVTNPGDQRNPFIHGKIVVWDDYRNSEYSDLYKYDLSTGVESLVAGGPGDQWMGSIWRGLIVFMNSPESLNLKSDVWLANQSGALQNLTNDTRDQWWPSISGNYVFWDEQTSLLNWDIGGIRLDTMQRFFVANTPLGEYESSTASGWVVWKKDAGVTGFDIWAKNLVTGETLIVCDELLDQETPSTDGRYVVWQDNRNPLTATDIYVFDLVTRTEIPICTKNGNQRDPRVHGNWIVWSDARGGRYDIYGYDLSTGTEHVICQKPQDQEFPSVYGGTVVWQDRRANNRDIYCAFLSRGWNSVGTIAQAKLLADGQEVALTAKQVTAAFGAQLYIEEADRSSGIQVTGGWDVAAGDLVVVYGVVKTEHGQRQIAADKVEKVGSAPFIKAVTMRTDCLGGQGIGPVVPPVQNRPGLHNVGLLVKVIGKVTETDPGFFRIDDGGGVNSGGLFTGVKVVWPGAPVSYGQFASVVGISSTEVVDGVVRPVVLVRTAADIKRVAP